MLEIGLMEVGVELTGTDLFSMERPPPLGEGELLMAELDLPRSSLVLLFELEENERIWASLPFIVADLAVIVISGFGEGSRDRVAFALFAAAKTSAIELLKVRGIAPVDSVLLNNWEFELFFAGTTIPSGGLTVGSCLGLPSLSNLARLGVGWLLED